MSKLTQAELDDRFEAMISEVASANNADERLAAILADPSTSTRHQVWVAAALGDISAAPAGSAALRAAFADAAEKHASASKSTESAYRDLICASITALAKREGPAATDILVSAASSSNPYIRDYGMSALASVADDSAWEIIMAHLGEILLRKTNSRSLSWQETCRAIEYLARHAPQGSDRATRLITLLHNRWRNLADPDLIEQWWPGIGGDLQRSSTIDLQESHSPQTWWE